MDISYFVFNTLMLFQEFIDGVSLDPCHIEVQQPSCIPKILTVERAYHFARDNNADWFSSSGDFKPKNLSDYPFEGK